MNSEFISLLYSQHASSEGMPSRKTVTKVTEGILQLFFPPLSDNEFRNVKELDAYAESIRNDILRILLAMEGKLEQPATIITDAFVGELPSVYNMLIKDAEAIADGDPAAQSIDEVVRTYPGFYAIAIYRLAHVFYKLFVPVIPRILTEYAHARTGIDIHPGADIGSNFCIDHGTGIVIGETTKVGRYVKIYQGVTLGALSVAKEMAKLKRHPTLEDNVVIYAGATILGGNTVIGAHSIIGGNVWLTHSVPTHSRVYHKSQITVSQTEDPMDIINFSI